MDSSAFSLPFDTGRIRSDRYFGEHRQDKAVPRGKNKSLERYKKGKLILQDKSDKF